MSWFNVDKEGLAATLERRGKQFVLFELVQNAWDSGASEVRVTIKPLPNSPFVKLSVEDNSVEGWADLADAFTMFGKSKRAGDATKRGRFCLGEKLVLAVCREAKISTAKGTVYFEEGGERRRSVEARDFGTLFEAEFRCTRDELSEIELAAMERLVPPVPTYFNGEPLTAPRLLKTFEAFLPTEIADVSGNLRRSQRKATVQAFANNTSENTGDILEMGIPVCSAEWPWRLNVLQKVPMGMDRDSVTDAFRKALQVAAVNNLAGLIDEEQAAAPWAREAAGDSRIQVEPLKTLLTKRHGDRVVTGVPNDPLANASAQASGCNVVYGGALSADEWNNVRKHDVWVSSSAAFPTPKPEKVAEGTCPLCGNVMRP